MVEFWWEHRRGAYANGASNKVPAEPKDVWVECRVKIRLMTPKTYNTVHIVSFTNQYEQRCLQLSYYHQ